MLQRGKFSSTKSFKTKPPLDMEIAGMSISIVALVGLFKNAITCFTRVRMAKTYGSDLEFLMVRFQVLHLRLTQWGEAAGLDKSSEDDKAPNTNLHTSDLALAIKALEQIKNRFNDRRINGRLGRQTRHIRTKISVKQDATHLKTCMGA
jgi:hypothetical protein